MFACWTLSPNFWPTLLESGCPRLYKWKLPQQNLHTAWSTLAGTSFAQNFWKHSTFKYECLRTDDVPPPVKAPPAPWRVQRKCLDYIECIQVCRITFACWLLGVLVGLLLHGVCYRITYLHFFKPFAGGSVLEALVEVPAQILWSTLD